MSAFEHVPYFLKCPNCGKVHLYEHIICRVDKMPTDIECPTCGTLMNWNNLVDIKAESWFSYKWISNKIEEIIAFLFLFKNFVDKYYVREIPKQQNIKIKTTQYYE